MIAILLIAAVSLLLPSASTFADNRDVNSLPLDTAEPTLRDIRQAISEQFYERFTLEIQDKAPQLPIYEKYTEVARDVLVFRQMAEMVRATAEQLLFEMEPIVRKTMEKGYFPFEGFSEPENLPTWQVLAALNMTFGDSYLEYIAKNCALTWLVTNDGAMICSLSFGNTCHMSKDTDEEKQMSLRLNELYLSTVYDEYGLEREKVRYSFREDYLNGLSNPLPGDMIKNCWYDPRDGHTRYHMGTDIRSYGGKKIHSMTDGTVIHVGYLPVPGNYVVIVDSNGYEYHYYHMRELSQYVKTGDTVLAGEIIGRVGNTGNSSANHLHLSVATGNNMYLNPFDLLVAAGFEPIRSSDIESRVNLDKVYLP